MLGKLVKYDLKYGAKIFIILHAVLLIGCLIGRFAFLDKIVFTAMTSAIVTPLILFSSMTLLLISMVCFGVAILIAARFYKNLFTDEGYLTLTLPATPAQHLWAKIISGAVWYVADVVLTAGALIILVTGKNVRHAWAYVAPEVTKALGMPLSHYALYLFMFTLFTSICSILMIYACISIGQLFPGHRVLCSIISYFVLSAAFQIITWGTMVIFNLLPNVYSGAQTGAAAAGQHTTMGNQLVEIFKISGFIYVILAIILYFITYYILNKKINLL